MEKSALNKLLSRIDNFIALALPYDQEIADFFKQDLSLFLGINISDEDFEAWLIENSNIIADKLGLEWLLSGDNSSNFLQAPFNVENNPVFIRLYKTPPSNREFFKLKEAAVLKGHGLIPPIYYYKVIVIPQITSGVEDIDKKYVKYLFLAEGIKKLFGNMVERDVFKEKFIEFLHANKNKINKLMSGIKSFPKFLGEGSDGVAFSVGEGQVLKLFKQKNSFDQSIAAIKRLHDEPDLAKTEAMIYDAGLLGEFDNAFPVYFYFIEKMKTATSLDKDTQLILSKLVSNINSEAKSFIYSYKQSYKEELDLDSLSVKAKSITNNMLNSFYLSEDGLGNLTEKLGLNKNWLQLLCEEIIMKNWTGRTDLAIRNLGINSQGEFRYFDPAFDFQN